MGLTARPRDWWIPWAITVVAATSVYAVIVGITGGFKVTLGFVRFSSHSWQRPAVAAAIGALALAISARAAIGLLVRRLASAFESVAFCRAVVGLAALWTLAVGI